MKRTLAALLAVSTLAAAVPAAAQPWRGEGRHHGGQAHRLEQRIDFLRDRGDITWREARDLHRQVDAIRRTAWRYGHDGLSNWERRDLDRRYEAIEFRIHREVREDRGRRDWRYGYD